MKCLSCKSDMKPGTTTFTVNRHGYHLVIDDLEAHVCPQCGETLLGEAAVEAIQQMASDLDARVENLRKAVA